MSLSGHFWTVVPSLAHRVRPKFAPPTVPWSSLASDAAGLPVRLSGALRDRADADSCVVVVHGLGGTIESHYCVRAAQALDARGWSSLRIALRGADRSGEDFYHAGLVEDLHAAFASPELARYRRLYVLGYSLGGHVALHAARQLADRRLCGVAAVCAPLDLDRSATAVDEDALWIYRRHILRGLNEIYAAVAARRAVPTPVQRVRQARTLREWDSLTVVPRYGFADVNDYYASMSIGPQLHALRCPTLLLPSRHDPMVPPHALSPSLRHASAALTVQWLDFGGHVGFPSQAGVEARIATWFSQQDLRAS
ncbi:MAG TPA: alpha/beta fold hydrolase [Polyangiales bacterium]